MRRLSDEDGAIAVIIGLSALVLFGFGAIAVDAGQLYQERRELQNGADAAALAAALDCADPSGAVTCAAANVGDRCPTPSTIDALENRIDQYANANANDAASSACVYELSLSQQFVTVETETQSGGNGFLTHWFAWAIGTPSTTVRAQATATWGSIGGGTTIPLAISYCEWSAVVPDLSALPSVSETIYFHTPSDTSDDCAGPAGQNTPGGFGWLDTDGSGNCQADVESGQDAEGDTGTPVPTAVDPACDSAFWQSLIGETVLVPVFSSVTGTGSNATYYIEGFAAFVLEGYRLSGSPAYNYPTPPPCNGADRCIRGHFVDYVTYEDYTGGGAADYGASVVTLTK